MCVHRRRTLIHLLQPPHGNGTWHLGPPLIGGEATHGLQMDDHTIFPSPISLAATWDIDLMKRYGQTVGSEARACGTHITWSPVLGLCREPRWGRCEEMMGEDTHLAAVRPTQACFACIMSI